ncbi:DNA-3-methyladenine glycosylase [Aeromicrobium sp. CF4.19]|uniref:DNA-3-methyladenine glycosylase n=1 Tax=Aeromicrobium sp. CF4.19 TaxID=3373082 RepID=UPI003EE68BD4
MPSTTSDEFDVRALYRSYGIHHCVNVVTGPTELAAAVLVRAGRVVDGLDLARQRRGDVPNVRLAKGPGNLAQALGLTLEDLGTELLGSGPVRLEGLPGAPPPMSSGPRVGVSRAADRPWRLWVTDDPTVSAYRRSARAPAP